MQGSENIMRRTKIICTLGPASNRFEIIAAFVRAGMSIARLNFSHGTHEEHAELIRMLRQVSEQERKPIAILQDLQGPRIRVGEIPTGTMELKNGEFVVITTRVISDRSVSQPQKFIPTTYENLPKDVNPGDRLLLDDGLLTLEVRAIEGDDVQCVVIDGGELSSHKGMNLPGVKLSTPTLTAKDKKDLAFGATHGVDFIALSFVRYPNDVRQVRKELAKHGASVPVIAKLEKPEAIENLDEILDISDGVMVARGDLGVEIGPEQVPIIQKEVIRKSIQKGKPVITATQMLESMRFHPHPTRAEASDVANAIFDGTDAVMLSGETAAGNFPIEAVQTMAKIIDAAEAQVQYKARVYSNSHDRGNLSFPDAVSDAACRVAWELKAKAIVAFTQSGFTARLISKYRPVTPIIAYTLQPEIQRQLVLNWGVKPQLMERITSIDEMIAKVEKSLLKEQLVCKGDTVVILAGAPIGRGRTTNLMTIHRIGGE